MSAFYWGEICLNQCTQLFYSYVVGANRGVVSYVGPIKEPYMFLQIKNDLKGHGKSNSCIK